MAKPAFNGGNCTSTIGNTPLSIILPACQQMARDNALAHNHGASSAPVSAAHFWALAVTWWPAAAESAPMPGEAQQWHCHHATTSNTMIATIAPYQAAIWQPCKCQSSFPSSLIGFPPHFDATKRCNRAKMGARHAPERHAPFGACYSQSIEHVRSEMSLSPAVKELFARGLRGFTATCMHQS